MTKEDKQIIDRATKENWRIFDRARLKRLLKKNLELYRENAELEQKLEQTEKDLADYQFNYPTIKELEKENEELRNNGFTVSAMTEQQLKVALEKGEQLEKENEELREELKEYKNGNFVQTVNQIIEGKGKQLEQARNLIDQFVNSSPYKTSSAGYFYKDLIKEAKQFLKEDK